MGLQISCGFHTEVPEESDLREDQEEPWRRVLIDSKVQLTRVQMDESCFKASIA